MFSGQQMWKDSEDFWLKLKICHWSNGKAVGPFADYLPQFAERWTLNDNCFTSFVF